MRKTMSEIREAKREDALADMRTRVADGSLRIRQMTADERGGHEAARVRRPRIQCSMTANDSDAARRRTQVSVRSTVGMPGDATTRPVSPAEETAARAPRRSVAARVDV
jgi:hypothetical protein